MGKRLTNREVENRQILRCIDRIKSIEKAHGIDLTKRACQRYALKRNEEQKLEREIAQREKELQVLKNKGR